MRLIVSKGRRKDDPWTVDLVNGAEAFSLNVDEPSAARLAEDLHRVTEAEIVYVDTPSKS